ncbi:MAG: hypothetical protein FJ293_10860 [Planctomycetes bacterium]|nr:hypothetical protein [Planctomycetota bacterium]
MKVPAFDATAHAAALQQATTATEAITLGDEAKAAQQPALADRAYARALELDPANTLAKRKLDVRPLDPATDFPGLDDVPFTQSWMVRPFLRLRGKELSRTERAAEVERWNAARASIDARVAEAADDPFLTKVDRMRNDLANKPFFENFDYEVIESTRPYALFVELKGNNLTERDARREAVEEAYAPYLAAYDKSIHDYLLPLSPKPPTEDPTIPVFILLDRASYDRFFQQFEESSGHPGMRAHFTPRERWCFTYSPEVTAIRSPEFIEGTQALLHEITHAWVDRIATDDGTLFNIRTVQTHWFNEGIAEWMSCHFRDGEAIRFQPWKSSRMQELTQRPAGVRIPFRAALKVGANAGLLEAEASQWAREQKVVDAGRATMIMQSGFYADMWLWIFWLEYANDARERKRFQDYARLELSGRGGTAAVDQLFADLLAQKDLEAQVDAFQAAVAKGTLKLPERELVAER